MLHTVKHNYKEHPAKNNSLQPNFVIFDKSFVIFLSQDNEYHFAISVNSL